MKKRIRPIKFAGHFFRREVLAELLQAEAADRQRASQAQGGPGRGKKKAVEKVPSPFKGDQSRATVQAAKKTGDEPEGGGAVIMRPEPRPAMPPLLPPDRFGAS